MPTINKGVIGTNVIESTNVKRDIDTMMKVIEPYQTPLLSWLFLQERNQSVVTCRYAKYEWYEKEYLPHLEHLIQVLPNLVDLPLLKVHT